MATHVFWRKIILNLLLIPVLLYSVWLAEFYWVTGKESHPLVMFVFYLLVLVPRLLIAALVFHLLLALVPLPTRQWQLRGVAFLMSWSIPLIVLATGSWILLGGPVLSGITAVALAVYVMAIRLPIVTR